MELFDNPKMNIDLDLNGNTMSREDMISMLAKATSWVYNIAEHSMRYDIISVDNPNKISCTIEDYRNTILDLHIVASEDVAVFNVFCAELDAGKENILTEYRAVGQDYQIFWFRQVAQTIFDKETKQPIKVVGRRVDVTRDKTSTYASKNGDDLTKLFHREKIRQVVSDVHAARPDCQAAYIMIDADCFNAVNKKYGKTHGDSVLKTLSGLIYTNFMSKDFVGRIAGDQFLVFCRDIEEDKLKSLLEKLRERIASNIAPIDGHPFTVSMGVSFSPKDGAYYDVLYAKADIALFEAKRAGGDRYMIYDEKTMESISMGYTLMKMGQFADDEARVARTTSTINKQLFDYSFEVMSKESDLNSAIEEVFCELGLFYGLDRAFVNEWNENTQRIIKTARWTRLDEKGNDIVAIEPEQWRELEEDVPDEGYWLFDRGRTQNHDFLRTILELENPPVSTAIFPIMENGSLVAIVGFETIEEYEFSDNCLATLYSIVRLIRSYMLNRQVKQVLQTEAIINKNVMEAQKVVFYIIDEETQIIKYLSKHAKAKYPNARYGQKCYESIFGRTEPCERCPLHCGDCCDSSVQVYMEDEDTWYTFTASHMKETESDRDVLICVTDVTDFLAKVRSHDSLTSAWSFDRFIVEATKITYLHEKKYDILCTGIWHFSKINDEYGYVIGDEILKSFAEVVSSMLRHEELFCRIKGDDFVLLIEHDEYDIVDTLTQINTFLNNRFKERFPNIELFCFAGSYCISDDDKYINKCVDNAMKARNIVLLQNQRNKPYYAYSAELEQKEREEQELSAQIKSALKDKRFEVYFQPKVDVNSSQIIGAEALVRMRGEDGNMVSPGLFVPMAEKNGMIVDIDVQVYEQTFAYMSKWLEDGKEVPLISVNVSRLHLLDNMLPQRIKKLSDRFGLAPERIELEITESVFFEDTERLIDMIRRLKDLGFVISMDDFGSGYSTLNFMKTLPVDVIKIDGGFFMRNQMDNKSKAIISAIIQLTKNLDFEIVSEGVETQEQVDFLREQGAKCVQGYYFYKPIPAEEFGQLI